MNKNLINFIETFVSRKPKFKVQPIFTKSWNLSLKIQLFLSSVTEEVTEAMKILSFFWSVIYERKSPQNDKIKTQKHLA